MRPPFRHLHYFLKIKLECFQVYSLVKTLNGVINPVLEKHITVVFLYKATGMQHYILCAGFLDL
jgi:hypothetical protein